MMQGSGNLCLTHDIEATRVCLSKGCADRLELLCCKCIEQKHIDHANKILTIGQLWQKLQSLTYNPINNNVQVNLYDLYHKISLLRNIRAYILQKQSKLCLNTYAINQILTQINQHQQTISQNIHTIQSTQQPSTALYRLKDYLQMHPTQNYLFIGGAVLKRQQRLESIIKQSLTFVNDLRQYLVKIIEVLMDQLDQQQIQYPSNRQYVLQQMVSNLIQDQSDILQMEIQSKIQLIAKINPKHPTSPTTYIECPEIEDKYRKLYQQNQKNMKEDIIILQSEKQQLEKQIQLQEQNNTLLKKQVKQVGEKYKAKFIEITQQLNHLKYQKQLLTSNIPAIKEQFMQMVYNQIEEYYGNQNGQDKQIMSALQNILNCSSNQILQKIQYMSREIDNVVEQKSIMQQQYQILKQQCNNAVYINNLHHLAAIAEIKDSNQQINNQLLRLKLQELTKYIHQKQQHQLNIQNINNQLTITLTNSEKHNLKLQQQINQKNNQLNKFLQDINKLQIELRIKSEQIQTLKQLSHKKIPNSLMMRKINSNQKDKIQQAIEIYKAQADQKLSILKNSIKAKQIVISKQKQQIQRLSTQKSKSNQKNNINHNQHSKDNFLLRFQEQKIKQLLLRNCQLTKNNKICCQQINELKINIKDTNQIITKLHNQNSELQNNNMKKQEQVEQLKEQLEKINLYSRYTSRDEVENESPIKHLKHQQSNGITSTKMKISTLTCSDALTFQQNRNNDYIFDRQAIQKSQFDQNTNIRLLKTSRTSNRNKLYHKKSNCVNKQECQAVKRLFITVNNEVYALQNSIKNSNKIQQLYKTELNKKREENKRLKAQLATINRKQFLLKSNSIVNCKQIQQQFDTLKGLNMK